LAAPAGVTVQAGVDGFGQTEHGRGYVGSDEGAYAVVDKVVFRIGMAVGISVVDKEVAAEDNGSVMVRGSIQNVAWTKCRTKYVKPLVHR